MIQLNLLPDVKLQYIKTRRNRRFIMSASFLVGAASLGVMAMLIIVANVYQSKKIETLDKQIDDGLAVLNEDPDLSAVLTIQDQLGSLPDLHTRKTASTRLLGYIEQVLPTGITITTMQFDFSGGVFEISGSAESIVKLNKLVDTLKFAQYDIDLNNPQRVPEDQQLDNAFANVILEGVSKSTEEVVYQITGSFKPAIFDTNSPYVGLVVPPGTTTRSTTEQPGSLFKYSPEVDQLTEVE